MNKATLQQEILEYTGKELQLEDLNKIDYCKILTNILQKSIGTHYYHVLDTSHYGIRFLNLTGYDMGITRPVPDQFSHINEVVDWCNNIIDTYLKLIERCLPTDTI